jgi:aldehyde dehydrogenase (NAD+)
MAAQTYRAFVGGEAVPAAAGETFPVENPYTGEEWAEVPRGRAADVDRAVAAARAAFEGEWGETTQSERREHLYDLADLVDRHAEELAELETKQNGRLFTETQAQMGHIAQYLRYFGRQCEEVGSGRVNPVDETKPETFNYVKKEPYGVVGAITPWNVPMLLSVWKLAPALAAGNTFVHKPSEHTPVSALRFAELVAEETDLPDGVYNVVPGYGPEAGEALTTHDDVDKIAFTGSTETGRAIAANAGRNLAAVSVELGGKSPNVIFPTADLDNAINGVMKGIFASTGQVCMAGSRVIVHEDIEEQFVEELCERAGDITVGDPMDPATDIGPVAFREQWETVREYVDRGTADGATLAYGGGVPEDADSEYAIQPTVLTDVDSGMQVAQEEIFGPVATVLTFADEDEAIELANDVDYGLAAGVWTEDTRQAHRLVDAIDAGTVWVNQYRLIAPNVPFGGFEDSGLGREAGREGLEEYYQIKSVWFDLSGEVSDPFAGDY